MSYHITVGYQAGKKYPFALNTEADQIPLTRSELESLRLEIECALLGSDPDYGPKNYPVYMIKEIRNECHN